MGQLYAGLARLSGLSTSATANVAQDAGLSFNDILQAYVIERFLTRLARSPHVDTVLPKGALMFEKGNEARALRTTLVEVWLSVRGRLHMQLRPWKRCHAHGADFAAPRAG
jgi:hypothetical protein